MTTMPVTIEQGVAACSDPVHLPLVDAAHAKPGGPDGQRMRRELCAVCPVFEHCLDWAMKHGEIGVWAGTSPNMRSRRGAPRTLPATPTYKREGVPAEQWRRKGAKPTGKRPSAAAIRIAELGVTSATVKRWAYEQGLAHTIKGTASLAQVEAYVSAHAAA